ncbi:Hydrolase OS=Streptomyces antimycoticus OX=68175 GN=SANT12839_048530 PE=4 SV=1 [Streptomyces antimycoticus]
MRPGRPALPRGRARLLTSVTLDRQLALLALEKIEAEIGPLSLAAARDGLDGEVLFGEGYRMDHEGMPLVPFTDPAELWSQPISKLYLQHPELDDDALADAARTAAGGLVGVTMAGRARGAPPARPHQGHRPLAGGAPAGPQGHATRSLSAICPMTSRCSAGRPRGRDGERAPRTEGRADEVTASNKEDGIAVVLERLFPAAPGDGGPPVTAVRRWAGPPSGGGRGGPVQDGSPKTLTAW